MDIKNIGIIGAGTMGNGIAQVCAISGFSVTMVDVNEQAVKRGVDTIGKNLARVLAKQKITQAEVDAAQSRIKTALSADALKDADILIEAATENLDLKRRIFADMDKIAKPGAILASNTSSISLTTLAAKVSRPDAVIGMHFFNPVPVMQLVEVIRALQTADATFEAVAALAKKLGKTPVAVKNSPGFVVNRLLVPMINEAAFALYEGLATAEDIDTSMKLGAAHPMGPLALADLIGLDVCLSVMEVLHEGFKDSKYRPCPIWREMVDAGYLGRKSGRGFFRY
jgi:3-hydroxybutyryl-CoA dehydrogenase